MTTLSRSSLQLVVAHYREDLRWLRRVPRAFQVVVYDKDPESLSPHGILRANEGREAGTYLHHIVEHYESLAEITVFCQGKPFDHAYDFHATLRDLASGSSGVGPMGFRWLGHIVDTDDAEGSRLFATWSKNPAGAGLDLKGFHLALLGTPGPENYTFYLGGQFAVSAERVRTRPRDFYRRALDLVLGYAEAAHAFERSWDRVFGVEGVPPEWVGGTVYLKPVKRLGQG